MEQVLVYSGISIKYELEHRIHKFLSQYPVPGNRRSKAGIMPQLETDFVLFTVKNKDAPVSDFVGYFRYNNMMGKDRLFAISHQ